MRAVGNLPQTARGHRGGISIALTCHGATLPGMTRLGRAGRRRLEIPRLFRMEKSRPGKSHRPKSAPAKSPRPRKEPPRQTTPREMRRIGRVKKLAVAMATLLGQAA